jgi:hypothetical protein
MSLPSKTRCSPFAAAALALAAAGVTSPAAAQVVSRVESPLRAADSQREGSKPPVAETSYYVMVLPASPSATTSAVESVAAVGDIRFPALRFVVSVSPTLLSGDADEPLGKESRALGALRHLHVRVTAVALDDKGLAIERAAPGAEPLTTLEIAPSEISYAASGGNLRSEASVAVSEILGAVGPIGGVLKAFQVAFHRAPPPTQIAYLSAPNAFGWRWYEAAGQSIEGLHYTAALFQVAPDVKSLRITVDVTAHWKAYGAWTKSYAFVFAVPPGS